jgi:signal transduction histidine kinase/CheY-like chemotaxis protein
MDDPLLQWLTRGVFILVFCLTLIDFLRWRDVPRLEVAALFGGLALVIVLQLAIDLTGVSLPVWAGVAGILALLAQPYLLLRVLAQFREVSRLQKVLGLIGLVGSWMLMLAFGSDLPPWATIAVVVAFTYVEGYATVSFARAALVHRGLSQRRLIAVAIGSGCLAACIATAGVGSAVPSARSIATPLTNLFALGSAVAYYVGLAPPRWLRRIWQGTEVQRFLLGLTGQSGGERVASMLEYLGPAAARAIGAKAALIGLATDDSGGALELHADSATSATLEQARITTFKLDVRSPVLSRAWRTNRCIAAGPDEDWGWELRALAGALHASGVLIAPLAAGGRTYGLFIVFVERASLFVVDDLSVLGVLADQAALSIEARRLLEESARERSTLAAVMASMHEGLLVMDNDRIVRYCNARTEELLGVARDRLLGTDSRSALATVRHRLMDGSAVISAWKRALRSADGRSTLDIELTAPPRNVQAAVFPVSDSAGNRRGVGVVLRDVTTERDLVRTKDELVSVVSHELRTPLASVVGFAELLRTRELPEAQRQKFLTVILEEGRRLTALINDFLDLQRMESGRQQIVPRPVEVAPLLEQCAAAAGEDATRPIQLDLADDLPAIRADSDRVSQVLSNLLSNARKYSPGGGLVTVSAQESNGQLIIGVQDHGLGLPPEALPRLFEKFYRVDNSDRRSITGTGLGLAISRKIVEAHGGRIWAESPGLGQGSRFCFTLPVAEARNTSGDVLIIEDDRGFARLLEAELANHGLSAVWVASAEDALAQVVNEKPKAIVLDLLLPGLHGEAFLERLRRADGGDVPVIVVTVKDLGPEERAALDELGVVAALRKDSAVGATASDIIQNALSGGELVAGGRSA